MIRPELLIDNSVSNLSMTRNNTTPTVPDEAVQRWQEAIVAAVNDASDFEVHTNDPIPEDDSPSVDVGASPVY
jgi:hypothetical protein